MFDCVDVCSDNVAVSECGCDPISSVAAAI